MKERKRKFNGTVEIQLLDPIKWEGRDINVVSLDFSKVTGKTLMDIDRSLKDNGLEPNPYNMVTYDYAFQLAAGISSIPARAFTKLSGDDADAVWQVVIAYKGGQDPQKVYDDLCEDTDEEAFTGPAN